MINPMALDNQVVIVTGAGQGIGRGVAALSAELGAKVVVNDLNEDGVKELAVGQDVLRSVTPGQMVIKIVSDHLTEVLGKESDGLSLNAVPPVPILVVGLQGSGKTTTTAKLAKRLKDRDGKRVLMASLDIYRPAAMDQLAVLGQQIGVDTLPIVPGENPVQIARRAQDSARRGGYDVYILDTAGRTHIDEELMAETAEIEAVAKPHETLLVADALTGQDAVNTAAAFDETLALDGVILTKLDGDARGGAAISIKNVTGTAVKFVGTGETLDRLEVFRAEGMASRILGMGDVVGLMKDFEEVVDEKKAEADAKRMLRGQFTLDDFLEQLQTLQNMGPLQDLLDKVPFFADSMPEGFQVDEREIGQIKAIVSSMTRQERAQAELFQKQPSRLVRVAKGSGTAEKQVAEILQRFD